MISEIDAIQLTLMAATVLVLALTLLRQVWALKRSPTTADTIIRRNVWP
jgi:hypothetical protein